LFSQMLTIVIFPPVPMNGHERSFNVTVEYVPIPEAEWEERVQEVARILKEYLVSRSREEVQGRQEISIHPAQGANTDA